MRYNKKEVNTGEKEKRQKNHDPIDCSADTAADDWCGLYSNPDRPVRTIG